MLSPVGRGLSLVPKRNLSPQTAPIRANMLVISVLAVRDAMVLTSVCRSLNVNDIFVPIARQLGFGAKFENTQDARNCVRYFFMNMRSLAPFLSRKGFPVIHVNGAVPIERTILALPSQSRNAITRVFTKIPIQTDRKILVVLSQFLLVNTRLSRPEKMSLSVYLAIQNQFIRAVTIGSRRMMTLFLAMGATVNERGKMPFAPREQRWAPLVAAIKCKQPKSFDFLIQEGANVSCRGSCGKTSALYWAAELGNDIICNILLMNKAKIDGATYENVTPLIIASRKGHERVIIELLSWDPNVNLQDTFGNTALHYARTASIALLLLNAKATTEITNNASRTPCELAALHRRFDVVETLNMI